MGRSTGAAVALVVGAVEILDLRIALIEMKVKVAAAIGADQQAGTYCVLHCWCGAYGFCPVSAAPAHTQHAR